jgi:hypothetical protein
MKYARGVLARLKYFLAYFIPVPPTHPAASAPTHPIPPRREKKKKKEENKVSWTRTAVKKAHQSGEARLGKSEQKRREENGTKLAFIRNNVRLMMTTGRQVHGKDSVWAKARLGQSQLPLIWPPLLIPIYPYTHIRYLHVLYCTK